MKDVYSNMVHFMHVMHLIRILREPIIPFKRRHLSIMACCVVLMNESNILVTSQVFIFVIRKNDRKSNQMYPITLKERPNEDDDIFSQDDPPNRGQTVFEVISTETVKEGRTSFVLYKILLTRSSVVDDTPCVIQRRYSDFEKLHSSLKKHYPTIMKQVSFPKKVFSGNFTPETIATRSRSFEQFLGHLYSIDTIRFCNLFKEFFYAQDLDDAYRYLSEESYFKATSLFLKVMPAQERIVGEFGMDVGATACALTASYMKLDEKEIALKYGLLALRCLKTSENSSLYVPLLNTCVHLCWVLGRDKQTLETKLFQLVPKETNIPELLDLILEERRTDETS